MANYWSVDCLEGTKPEDVEWPENAYAFTLWTRTDIAEGDDVFKGEAQKIGKMYYHPDSKVENYDMVKRNPNANEILLSNMKNNHWQHIVWSRWGNWPQPYDMSKHAVVGG